MTNPILQGFLKRASAFVTEPEAVRLWKEANMALDAYMLPPGQQQATMNGIRQNMPQMPQPAQVMNAFGQPSAINAPQPQQQPYMQMAPNAQNIKPNEYSSPLEVQPNNRTPVSAGVDLKKQINPTSSGGSGMSAASSGVSSAPSKPKSSLGSSI